MGADATHTLRTFRFLFPPSPLDWILSHCLYRAGEEGWRLRCRMEKRGGSLPLSHPLRVAVPVYPAPGEQLSL